jgi:hypothetical protein
MALNFLKNEINNKKRKAEAMLPPPSSSNGPWVTRGDLEKERERAYLEEQAKIEEARQAVRLKKAQICCVKEGSQQSTFGDLPTNL